MHDTFTKHLGEAAMALEGWESFQLPAVAAKLAKGVETFVGTAILAQ